jgi:hypothetical protein
MLARRTRSIYEPDERMCVVGHAIDRTPVWDACNLSPQPDEASG